MCFIGFCCVFDVFCNEFDVAWCVLTCFDVFGVFLVCYVLVRFWCVFNVLMCFGCVFDWLCILMCFGMRLMCFCYVLISLVWFWCALMCFLCVLMSFRHAFDVFWHALVVFLMCFDVLFIKCLCVLDVFWHAFDMVCHVLPCSDVLRRSLMWFSYVIDSALVFVDQFWFVLMVFLCRSTFPAAFGTTKYITQKPRTGNGRIVFSLIDTCLCRNSQCQCHGPMAQKPAPGQ